MQGEKVFDNAIVVKHLEQSVSPTACQRLTSPSPVGRRRTYVKNTPQRRAKSQSRLVNDNLRIQVRVCY